MAREAAKPWVGNGPVASDGGGIGETLMLALYVVFAGSMLVLPFATLAVYSGAMRWLFALSLVTAVGIVGAVKFLHPLGTRAKARESEPAARAPRDGYASLAEMAKRAESGYAYSQKSLDERMADAFLEKLRVRHGLQPGAVFRLAGDRGLLAAACGDDELAAFVVESKAAMSRKAAKRGLFGRMRMARGGEAYRARAERIMSKIEAWE